MSDYVLEAELREKTGRNESRRLRRAGKLPAVIYGGGKPDLPVTLDSMHMAKILNEESFHASMIELNVAGNRGKHTALVKDVQWDPVRDEAIHIDFHRVSSSDTVKMEVPVHPVNFEKSPGDLQGGSVEIIRHAVEVECRADAIPDTIEVDCSQLDIGDSIHVQDLVLPDGVQAPNDVNFTILAISAPTKMEEPAEVEAAEAEAEAEAAEAEAESGE
jgi:large subunit ribosomal protein L25